MNSFKDKAKYCAGILIKGFWRIAGRFLPSDGRKVIVFDSFAGKQYSCNPRAVYEAMCRRNANRNDYLYVWAFIEPEKFDFLKHNNSTIVVKYHSFAHHRYIYQAKALVFNWKITYDLPVRKGQMVLQTWHGGGCYKKAGTEIMENSKWHTSVMQKQTNLITYYISSSRYFSKHVIRQQQKYKGKILNIGMPRNDMLVHPDMQKAEEIRKALHIPSNAFVVLYAPTYRDSIMNQQYATLDYKAVQQAAEERFQKKVVLLYRGHHYMKQSTALESVTDVSDYKDMQDLLLICDMLISDYSSSIWDYSYTFRPCFLYTPDLEEYIANRGFDEDIDTWGFPVAISNHELVEAILHFNERSFKNAMQQHHEKLGSYESGTATQTVCDLIINRIEEDSI